MRFFREICVVAVFFLVTVLSDNSTEISCNKTRYLGSEERQQGYQKAVDGNLETFTNIEEKWLIVDLGRPYIIEAVQLSARKNSSLPEVNVLTLNNYDVRSNVPNANVQNVCATITNMPQNSVNEEKLFCSPETSNTAYRYVALYKNSDDILYIHDFKVYAGGVDVAINKTVHQALNTEREYPGCNYVINDQIDQVSGPSWLVVDLGKRYNIGHFRMNFRIKSEAKDLDIQVLTLNDFDAHKNPPNPELHNVCFKFSREQVANGVYKWFDCSEETSLTAYRYIALWNSAYVEQSVHVFQVYQRMNSTATEYTDSQTSTMTTL